MPGDDESEADAGFEPSRTNLLPWAPADGGDGGEGKAESNLVEA